MFDHYYIYETKIIDRYEDLSSIDHDKPGNRANRDFVVVNIPVSDHEHEDRRVNVRHYYHGKIGDPVKVVTNDDKIRSIYLYYDIFAKKICEIYVVI